MEYIQIPVPDFSFADYAKRTAMNLINTYITEGNISVIARSYTENSKMIKEEINNSLSNLGSKEDRLVFISELLARLMEFSLWSVYSPYHI